MFNINGPKNIQSISNCQASEISARMEKSQPESSARSAYPLVGPMKGAVKSVYPNDNYRVALINPEALPSRTTGVAERTKFISNTIQEADKLFKKQEKKTGIPKKKLFVAPENFFQKAIQCQGIPQHPKLADRQLTQDDKRFIVSEMQKISARHPDITIMPGSINWKKEANRTEDFDQYMTRHGISDNNHPDFEHRQQKYFNKQNQKTTHPVNDPQNPNTRINKANQRNIDANEKYGTKLTLPNAETTHIVHNTAYTFQSGQILSKHHKIAPFDDIRHQNDQEKRIFSPGDRPGHFKLPDGSVATVEICYDNDKGITGNANNPVKPGNIHILESDRITEQIHPNVAEKSNLFVHASTKRAYKSVVKGNINIHGVKTINNDTGEKSEVTPVKETESISLYEPGTKPSKNKLKSLVNKLFK